VPTPSKPCGQARRKLKKIKENARSSLHPTYPQAQRRGEAVPLPLSHFKLKQSSEKKKKKKCTSKLKNEKRELEIATKFPQGVLKCCVCLFGAAKSLQPDLIYLLKQQALLARMATHNQEKLRKPLPFWGKNFPQ
jgi:hypothetical protein